MDKLDAKNVAYYGKPITSLTKAELIEALMEMARIINDCPVKGECNKLIEKTIK